MSTRRKHNTIVTKTDSYKLLHWAMEPENTQHVYSYQEARTGAKFNKTIAFGYQYYLMEHLAGQVVTKDGIDWGESLTKAHIGSEKFFNREMWEYILRQYEGRLPITIKAVPEGTPVDISNAMFTIVNTDKKLTAPLTNHLETILSMTWAPSTVATLSYEIYKLLEFYRKDTCDTLDGLKFGLHDFGYRGTVIFESAGLLGAAHLINFLGTDTIAGMETAIDYYNADLNGLAYSVAATEHSIMTALGEEGEEKMFRDILMKFPSGILSIVIDSYSYQNVSKNFAKKYKDLILARVPDANGIPPKVVFRPDSGDPTSVTLEVMENLGEIFGTTENNKGYTELNPKVGVLWGDGIDYTGIRNILFALKLRRYASNNIVFGMGGGLLQKVDRDTQRFAFKSSAQCRDDVWHDVYKKPMDVSKVSKRGILKLVKDDDGSFHTYNINDPRAQGKQDQLVEVFKNGEITKEYSFAEIRKNSGTW